MILAFLLVILAMLAICSIGGIAEHVWEKTARYRAGRAAKRARRRLRRMPPDPWETIDYSAKRARALEQLGDDYLLARPINRRYT